jgi:adenylate cyclase
MQGEFMAARTHVERGIALYDPAQHHRLAFLYGGCDPSVYCLSYDALILWFLGYPDQALQKGQDAIASAQRLSHVSSLASTMVFTSYLHHFYRDQEALERRAEAIVELSTQHGFAYWLAAGTMTQGYLLAQQSAYEEGIAQIRQGLNAAKETAEELIVPFFLSLVADLYRRAGQVDEALTVVAEALAIIERTGERWWEAELYRLNGVLFMQKDDIRAETSLHRALDVARRQHAKSLELRATTSLSRLWAQQGRRREARDPLAAACDWFTEGFESPDFKEAKALLDTLM